MQNISNQELFNEAELELEKKASLDSTGNTN